MFKPKGKGKRLVIEKKDTSTTIPTETFSETISYEEDTDYTATEQDAEYRFMSIVNSNYQKPREGTYQDNMSTEDIRKRIEGCHVLKTIQEMRVLETLPVFKTWIRYINRETRQFRTGGLLMKVSYPDYIMLVNPSKNLTWSVQLKDNVLFYREPELVDEETVREQAIKDRLYELYKRGDLYSKKHSKQAH